MEPTRELINHIEQSKIDRARRMTFEQRFLAGAELFDYACSVARAGIRMQHPDATDEEVEVILAERLERARKWERRS